MANNPELDEITSIFSEFLESDRVLDDFKSRAQNVLRSVYLGVYPGEEVPTNVNWNVLCSDVCRCKEINSKLVDEAQSAASKFCVELWGLFSEKRIDVSTMEDFTEKVYPTLAQYCLGKLVEEFSSQRNGHIDDLAESRLQ